MMTARHGALMVAVRKRPNVVDGAVAQRIRLFRMNTGLSQTELGNRIGVTFQQIQKYEKGANRVGAGRLTDIAKALGVSVDMLFPETAVATKAGINFPMPVELLTEPHALEALQAFSAIPDRQLRQIIVRLLEHLSKRSPAQV